MSVTRINRFVAKEGKVHDLREFLRSITPIIRKSKGCRGCALLQNHDRPGDFIVLEEWESVEAHQESVERIPREKIGQVTPLLASPPESNYYSPIEK